MGQNAKRVGLDQPGYLMSCVFVTQPKALSQLARPAQSNFYQRKLQKKYVQKSLNNERSMVHEPIGLGQNDLVVFGAYI